MTDKHILHMLTPLKHMSPFDVNMALDAGYDAVVPYTQVTLSEVQGLVQDAMFSRPPKTGTKTAVFFAGKQAIPALDMLEAARKALVPPAAATPRRPASWRPRKWRSAPGAPACKSCRPRSSKRPRICSSSPTSMP